MVSFTDGPINRIVDGNKRKNVDRSYGKKGDSSAYFEEDRPL